MDRRSQEKLSALDPEVRIARMQGHLAGILDSGWKSTYHMIRFINLFDVHTPTIPPGEYDGFLERLDRPGQEFHERVFDYLVEAYDDFMAQSSVPLDINPSPHE
jgi:hypothetical protein